MSIFASPACAVIPSGSEGSPECLSTAGGLPLALEAFPKKEGCMPDVFLWSGEASIIVYYVKINRWM